MNDPRTAAIRLRSGVIRLRMIGAATARRTQDLQDTRTKAGFYPDVDKQDLFREEYIAARSSHSRGSTVDITLVALDALSADVVLIE